MRIFLWISCVASLFVVWYSNEIHLFFSAKFSFYHLDNHQLIQIVFSVIAGIFATKASDSSNELRKLLKVKDIQELLGKADKAANQSEEETKRLRNIVKLVATEVEQQFAREMLINHRKQLAYHWEQILILESVIGKEETEAQIDLKVRKIIQQYIVRTQYIEYMGKGFLRNIPFFGKLLDYILGPAWNAYYLKNMHRFNRLVWRRNSSENSQQSG